MVISLLQNYSWFIIITYIANGSLLAGVSMAKRMPKGRLKKFLLTPLDLNKKFIDKRGLIGDHKPIAGLFITAFWSTVFFLAYKELFALILPFSVFAGDIIGSFLKRRMGIKNGQPLLMVDQLNFFVASYLVVLWLGIRFPLVAFLQLSVLTIFIHIGTNIFAYKIGVKDEPW